MIPQPSSRAAKYPLSSPNAKAGNIFFEVETSEGNDVVDAVRKSPSFPRKCVHKVVTPLICSAIAFGSHPFPTHASIPSESLATTITTSSPPSNVARLLLDPPSSVSMNKKIVRQLTKQADLQDSRLAQCHEFQQDWEQCFFYGTTPQSLPGFQGDQKMTMTTTPPANGKTKIPTW